MEMHNDKEVFQQIILAASNDMHIPGAVIEKDYYVTVFLKKLVKGMPELLFKGGTSLSKCYKVINRFSEDIDITLETDNYTQGKRQSAKKAIVKICEELGLSILNLDDTRSKRDFNRYQIDYSAVFTTQGIKDYLYVETGFLVMSFPGQTKPATSIIYDYLQKIGRSDIIDNYDLRPFDIRVLSMERTFIDKVFAICDYAYDGKIYEHSRHLYDLHKMFPLLTLDDTFAKLVVAVRALRKIRSHCPSAADGVNISEKLRQIIKDETYKKDYEDVTEKLLFEKVTYAQTIDTLQKIIEKNVF